MKPAKQSLGGTLKTIFAFLKQHQRYIMWVLFLGYTALRFAPSLLPSSILPQQIREVSLALLGAMLLQLLFEIHTTVVDSRKKTIVFENFIDTRDTFFEELRLSYRKGEPITIRYLGLVGYHWQDIEPGLTDMLATKRVKNVTLDLLILDYNWDGLNALSPTWKNQGITTNDWVNAFTLRHRREIRDLNWSISLNTYRNVPQIWGICVNNDTLFRCTAYWNKIEEETPDGSKIVNYLMRGGLNPVELIKRDDENFSQERIDEFIGWFDYYKSDQYRSILRL